MAKTMTLTDCKKGMRVKHIPTGENGVISSVGQYSAFVKYDTDTSIVKTGEEDITARATHPQHLAPIDL